jgi:chorismate--pyruvate lyase
VLARSVTTAEGLHRAWRGLRTLGRQPLATLLWSDPRIRRGRFEYARLAGSSSLARAVGVAADLPARRSCFWRDGQPLIVMEAFAGLPWPAVAGLPPRRR